MLLQIEKRFDLAGSVSPSLGTGTEQVFCRIESRRREHSTRIVVLACLFINTHQLEPLLGATHDTLEKVRLFLFVHNKY